MTDGLDIASEAESPLQAIEDAPKEELLSKDMVSKIVERERLKAFEKGKKEALMEQMQNQATQSPPTAGGEQGQAQNIAQPIQTQNQGLGGMAPAMSQEQIEHMIMQKAPEALMQQFNQMKQASMVDSFVSKMQSAEQRYPGLEEKLNRLNYNDPAMHSLIEIANNLENTGDVINELVSNPAKMIQVLAGIKEQPYLAQESLNSLSNSIKTNQAALAEENQAREPLSQMKPSISAGMADSTQLTVHDLRKMLSKRK